MSKLLTLGVLQQGSVLNYLKLINDGNTMAWYDSSDLTTITKDASEKVSRWNDKLGSGRDLIQSTNTKQPLYSSEGLLFDGIDDYLKSSAFDFIQPIICYMVFKQITWTAFDYIFDGNLVASLFLYQNTISPSIRAGAGVISNNNTSLAIDTFGIARILYNGVNSKIQINNNDAVTGNFGTNAMNGITIGAAGNGGNSSNILLKEIIFRNPKNDNEQIYIYNYLRDKYFLNSETILKINTPL